MTVIAWDGKTLAADKRMCIGGQTVTVTKIFRVGDCLVGFSGFGKYAGAFKTWLEHGSDPTAYPGSGEDVGSYALVVHLNGRIERYESTPYPIVIEDRCAAAGSGRDYARAVMHLGHNALRAVEVACLFDECCGNGIDSLTFDHS